MQHQYFTFRRRVFFWVGLLFLGFLFSNESKAQELIELDNETESFVIGLEAEILIDSSNTLTFKDVQRKRNASLFQKSTQKNPNFGYSQASFWFRFRLKDNSDAQHQWLLHITHANMDFIDLYIENEEGDFIQKSTGATREYSTRDFFNPFFLFDLNLKKDTAQTIYLNFRGKSSKQFPIKIISKNEYIQSAHVEDIFMGIFLGFFVVMIVYNLFIFLSIRVISYLYYVLFIFSFLLMQISLSGHIYELRIPVDPLILNTSNLVFANMAGFFGIQFARNFLNLKALMPLISKWLLFFDILTLVMIAAVFIGYFVPSFLQYLPLLTSYSVLLSSVALLAVGSIAFYKKYRPARFYMLAWSFLLVGGVIYVLRNSGVLPNNLFTYYAFRIGAALEVLLLSLGLADRFRIAEDEKQKAQDQMIKTLQEKENLITEQNTVLENTVKERTETLMLQTEELMSQREELMSQRDSLEQQSSELVKKNEDIVSSINYAQRIQQAILPTQEKMKDGLKDFFILFRPREIVSGDFYWFTKKEDRVILGVIDCTGHGVPGAFMSMIGNDLLNQVVHDKEIHEPDKILNEMHKGIRYALRQDETDNRDGMDVSLVVIDPKNKILEFAGAKNSLIYIQNGELHQIKGDKTPIGGEQREVERKFKKHIIPLDYSVKKMIASHEFKPNREDEFSQTITLDDDHETVSEKGAIDTMIYLFSDGYQDQFGGKDGKKFLFPRLRDTFLRIHHLPLEMQKKELENVLDHWMNESSQRQIDDILVMGIRISDLS